MQLYTNGTVISMVQGQTAEAVLTDQGKIVALGNKNDMLARSPNAELIDLDGATLIPAFIDAHSHFSSYASSFLQVALEECVSFEEIGEKIRAFQQHLSSRGLGLAKGYDTTLRRRKTIRPCSLDSALGKIRLFCSHASGPFCVFNTPALKFSASPGDTFPGGAEE